MSHWTSVRIIYDVGRGYPNREGSSLYYNNDLRVLEAISLEQALYTADMAIKFKKDSIFSLGSEGPVSIKLTSSCGSSIYNSGRSLSVLDRGHLVIVGDLRDCTRGEFTKALNEYINHLKKYCIYIYSGLVSIV